MDNFNDKLNEIYPGYVVRKDLEKLVKGNTAIPGYVLEFLLRQNCATNDEDSINAGVGRVKGILAKHYVERAEAGAVRSDVKQTGFHRVIDKVSVELNERRDVYEATFKSLGIKHVRVDSETMRTNRRLLVSGVWRIEHARPRWSVKDLCGTDEDSISWRGRDGRRGGGDLGVRAGDA